MAKQPASKKRECKSIASQTTLPSRNSIMTVRNGMHNFSTNQDDAYNSNASIEFPSSFDPRILFKVGVNAR